MLIVVTIKGNYGELQLNQRHIAYDNC